MVKQSFAQHLDTRATSGLPGEIDIEALGSIAVTSEYLDHPVEHAFDRRRGPGGSRWVAADGGVQAIIIAFDAPQTIRGIDVEVEEQKTSRTQQLFVALSQDGGRSYREFVRQEYNFAPPGTTFEREQWAVNREGITNIRLVIIPDKSGRPCRASLTTFAVR